MKKLKGLEKKIFSGKGSFKRAYTFLGGKKGTGVNLKTFNKRVRIFKLSRSGKD